MELPSPVPGNITGINSRIPQLVIQDPGLNEHEKQYLLQKLNEPTFLQTLGAGSAGATTMIILAKFMQLSKPAQVVLGLMGFGFGKYLLDKTQKHDRFMQYNEKLRAYEIKQ